MFVLKEIVTNRYFFLYRPDLLVIQHERFRKRKYFEKSV